MNVIECVEVRPGPFFLAVDGPFHFNDELSNIKGIGPGTKDLFAGRD